MLRTQISRAILSFSAWIHENWVSGRAGHGALQCPVPCCDDGAAAGLWHRFPLESPLSLLPLGARIFPGHIHLGPEGQEHLQLPEARAIKGALSEFLKQRFLKRQSTGFCGGCWGTFYLYFTTAARLQNTCWACLSALVSSIINASLIFPAALFGRGFSFTKLS